MKALLFHCKNYATRVDRLSNLPKDIEPEEIKEKEQKCGDCIVSLITIEKGDDIEETSSNIAEEISKFCDEVGHKNIVLLPFAHLSNNLAKAKDGIKALDLIENKLKKKFDVMRAHFGSHKSLLLDIYGHVGNARYREF
ncbi:MAG: threonyl-tRNA synthetase editing domain-containing protein [Nanoarchaeota archaeon]